MLDNLLGNASSNSRLAIAGIADDDGEGEEEYASSRSWTFSNLCRQRCYPKAIFHKLPLDLSQIRLRFWFHVLLLVFATVQLFVDTKESEYLLTSRRNWMHFFYPTDYELNPTDDSPSENYYLYTVQEVQDAVRHALESYESIVKDSIDALSYRIPDLDEEDEDEVLDDDEEDEEVAPPALMIVRKYTNPYVFEWRSKKLDDNSVVQSEYLVNSTNFLDTGLFNSRRDVRRITDLVLRFQVVSTELISMRKACLVWNIELAFGFQYKGQIALTLNDRVLRDCDDTASKDDILTFGEMLWVNIVLLMLSFAYFVTMCVEAEDLTEFSMWRLSEVVCLACISISSGMNLSDNAARKPTESMHSALISLGQGLVWGNLIQYFSLNQNMLVLTLERTIPRVLKFLLEITPIFVGYAVFGVSFFSHLTVRFSGLRNSFATLFSLINGDAIADVFEDLMEFSPGVAQVYIYTFVMVGSYVILNIVIAIVEEAYFAANDIHQINQEEAGSRAAGGGGGGGEDDERQQSPPPVPYQGRFGFAARRARFQQQLRAERQQALDGSSSGSNNNNNLNGSASDDDEEEHFPRQREF